MTTSSLTIYKQIYPLQCAKLSTMGYHSLINVRPDGEGEKQPKSIDLQQAAHSAGLNYVYLPFTIGHLSSATVIQFAYFYNKLPKPIMLFCHTGYRARLLYQSACIKGLLHEV